MPEDGWSGADPKEQPKKPAEQGGVLRSKATAGREDFAETWAHYFHMVDTLGTAGAFRLRVRPKVAMGAELSMTVDFDPHTATMDRIIDSWLPLTFAVNSINRSMGLSDLYPFVLAPPVIVKLSFIHKRIHAARGSKVEDPDGEALRAAIAGVAFKN